MTLAQFNSAPAAEAAATASVWAAIPAWVDGLVAARPFEGADAAVTLAAELSRSWSAADLDTALAHHPRIGEKPRGAGAEADASRTEQAPMADAGAHVTARIAAANAAYERRFGRVFLIRAAGRSPEEMLAEAERRLELDAADEASEALEQLRQIALLRLRSTLEDTP